MTIGGRFRESLPHDVRLSRVPLRTKLVAAVLVLVAAALLLISSVSTYALRLYLDRRMDSQLAQFSENLINYPLEYDNVAVPPEYRIAKASVSGTTRQHGDAASAEFTDKRDLAPLLKNVTAETAHLNGPYTVRSINGKYLWRVLITPYPDGSLLYVEQRMTGVEEIVAQLAWVDFLVGAGVLIALASIGAAVVRQSLVPLLEIERTAAAIGAGDLSRRVRDPEAADGVSPQQPRTELGRLSRALNAMLAQLEAAFLARAHSETAARDAAYDAQESEARAVRSEGKMRQFVADASHELRTPLTTIRGFAELYRQGAVTQPEDVARLVRRIEDEASRMGLLVEDLLLLARLDRERPFTFAPVELPVLALDAVQAAEATAPDRAINLEIDADPDRLVAYGDDARLRQVVGNLMTNAIVHTPPGAELTLRLAAPAEGSAVIDIKDTGPGLTPEQQAHVFERFYRADEARTRDMQRAKTGTGLGLAIVAAIVRSHNGTVEVLSEPGKGATFRVTLPTLNSENAFSENIQQ